MVNLIYNSCDFLYTAVKAWVVLQLAAALSNPKHRLWVEQVISYITIIVIAFFNTYNHKLINVQFSNNGLIVIILLMTIICSVIYECKIQYIFGVSFLVWVGFAMLDFLFQTVLYLTSIELGRETKVFLSASVYRSIYLLLCSIIAFIIGQYACRWSKRFVIEIKSFFKWIWILAFPLFGCMIYFQRIYLSVISEQLISRWWIFFLAVTLAVLLYLMDIVKKKQNERFLLQQQRLELLDNNYYLMSQIFEEKNILLHDIKAHMQVIRGLAERGESHQIISYVDGMYDILQMKRTEDFTNHKLLNLIFSIKFQEAERAGIVVQYEFADMESLELLPIEVCSLFSNLLENAIEANQRREEGLVRWIKFFCKRKGDLLIISTSNPVDEKTLKVVDGIFKTSKQDSHLHGLGIRSIQQVIDAHDGYMVTEIEDGIFHLTACLNGFI